MLFHQIAKMYEAKKVKWVENEFFLNVTKVEKANRRKKKSENLKRGQRNRLKNVSLDAASMAWHNGAMNINWHVTNPQAHRILFDARKLSCFKKMINPQRTWIKQEQHRKVSQFLVECINVRKGWLRYGTETGSAAINVPMWYAEWRCIEANK